MADDARTERPPIDALHPEAPPPDEPEPWWGPGVRLARWMLGAFTLVGGLTWILVNLTGPNPLLDLVIGVVLAAGALVLLMPHRIQLPKLPTVVAVVGGGVAGTAAGLLGGTGQTCCAFAYVESKGWPFTWAQRGAEAADPGTAFRLAQSADWHVDVVALGGNLLLWSYLGMLCVVIAVLVRRDQRHPGEARPE